MSQWRIWFSLLVAAPLVVCVSSCQSVSTNNKESEEVDGEATWIETVQTMPATDPVGSTSIDEDPEVLSRARALARYACGYRYEMLNEGDAAFEEYLQSAKEDPSNEALVIRLASQLIGDKRTSEAKDLLTLSAKRKDASASIIAWHALAEASDGNTKSAIKIAKEAIRKDVNNTLAYQVLFGVYADEGNKKAALQILQDAEKVGEKSVRFLLELSQLYLNNEEQMTALEIDFKAESKRLADKAATLMETQNVEENKPEYRELLGNLYSGLEEHEKALALYEGLLKEYPNHVVLKEKQATELFLLGRLDEAEEILRPMLRENVSTFKCLVMLGDIYQQRKKFSEAADFYYYAATISNNPNLYVIAGTMRLWAGMPQRALDVFELARTPGVKSFRLEFMSALAYCQLGRYGAAIEAIDAAEVIDKADGSKNLDIDFYLSLADIYEKSGDTEKSIAIMEDLLAKNPDSAQCLNSLGYTYADKGMHLEQALKMVQKAVKDDPENEAYIDSLAWVLHRLNRNEEALTQQLRVTELAAELSPESQAEYFDHLGDIYLALGRKTEALAAWNNALEQLKDLTSDEVQKKRKELEEKVKANP